VSKGISYFEIRMSTGKFLDLKLKFLSCVHSSLAYKCVDHQRNTKDEVNLTKKSWVGRKRLLQPASKNENTGQAVQS
jgi:hypothetical protein